LVLIAYEHPTNILRSCEKTLQRVPADGYEIDPYMEGGLSQTPSSRTPLRELTNSRAITPVSRKANPPGKTPRKTPSKTPGKTPGTVRFNAAIMAFHNAIQTPEFASEAAFDAENIDSPASPLIQKTCPPKQMGQSFLASDGPSSAVQRRLFRNTRKSGIF